MGFDAFDSLDRVMPIAGIPFDLKETWGATSMERLIGVCGIIGAGFAIWTVE